jgi:hypothetical protein
MSPRPRYSLLTLLLLTAGIAVGVKLWRGPHRLFIPADMLPAGDSLYLLFPSAQPVALKYGSLKYELEYFREWQGVNYTTLMGRPDPETRTYLQPGPASDPSKAYLYRVAPLSWDKVVEDEHVVCWFFENEHHVERHNFWKSDWKALLLTNQRNLYSFESWYADKVASRITLDEIEDSTMKFCVQLELEKLPAPTK